MSRLKHHVNILNSFKTRNNVLKIFKSDNHKFNVIWNQNKNLFVFENAVYDLNIDDFINPKPDDYMNSSCGYNFEMGYYSDLDTLENIEIARRDIQNFIKGIVLNENYEYLMKYLSSFLKQENKEELAHFFLGTGRNAKGTLTTLTKNTLGNYWGELSMDFFIIQIIIKALFIV